MLAERDAEICNNGDRLSVVTHQTVLSGETTVQESGSRAVPWSVHVGYNYMSYASTLQCGELDSHCSYEHKLHSSIIHTVHWHVNHTVSLLLSVSGILQQHGTSRHSATPLAHSDTQICPAQKSQPNILYKSSGSFILCFFVILHEK